MAVLDQALFAGSNFVINILLARQLSQTNFGIFSLGFTAFVFAGVVHTSFLTEPIKIFGTGFYASRLFEYWKIIEKIHLILSSCLAACFGVATIVNLLLGHYFWVLTMGGLALSTPFIYYQWMIRSYCYVAGKPQYISYAAIVYCSVLFLSFALCYYINFFNPFTVFISMGVSSATSSWLLRSILTRNWLLRSKSLAEDAGDIVVVEFSKVLRQHWTYGKWSLVANVVRYLPANIPYLLLGTFKGGLEVAGSLKAVYNLILPMSNILMALSNYLVPSFSRFYKNFSTMKHHSLEYKALGLYAFIAGANAFALIFFGKYFVQALYHGRYEFTAVELTVVGLIPFVESLLAVFFSSFRAQEKARLIIFPTVVSAIVVTLGCFMLMRSLGLIGILSSILVSGVASLIVAYRIWFLTRKALFFSIRQTS
jgi:O-antigen/teichoic acid export membrane protein